MCVGALRSNPITCSFSSLFSLEKINKSKSFYFVPTVICHFKCQWKKCLMAHLLLGGHTTFTIHITSEFWRLWEIIWFSWRFSYVFSSAKILLLLGEILFKYILAVYRSLVNRILLKTNKQILVSTVRLKIRREWSKFCLLWWN